MCSVTDHALDLGSVKDSVVGEERIAQYLLAVLNTRQTPLHWKNVHNDTLKGLQNENDDKRDYNLKDLLPKRRVLPVTSNVHYVEVTFEIWICILPTI